MAEAPGITGTLSQVNLDYAGTLTLRAQEFMESAKVNLSWGRYDVAAFNAAMAAELAALEDARETGQYGDQPVDRDRAEAALSVAEEVVGLVRRYWQLRQGQA